MRIVYFDIDTLRPDHLGCYGYHRNTSPNIDDIAKEGVRFDNCYVSDSPCLPSRAALYSGKCGIRNGAVNHGGAAADPYINPATRNFSIFHDNYTMCLADAGFYPVSVSPFGQRHSAFWIYNGFREVYNTGKTGHERADEIVPVALDWLDRKGAADNWYLHINVWDPHTPYQAPAEMGNPFETDPPPVWMTETICRKTWDTYGPGSAQEPGGDYLSGESYNEFDRMPNQIKDMAAYKKWIDGYDCGIHYMDMYVGKVIDKLKALGVYEDTLIIISSDHGENQGELSVYGDHQTADNITNHVPFIIRHPDSLGGKGRADSGIYYQFDLAATLLEMVGGEVPASWDGKSFLEQFKKEESGGRDCVVVSHCAWSVQRGVRKGDYFLLRTYHAGFKNYPDVMLFNIKEDPHETKDLADKHPDIVNDLLGELERWTTDMMRKSEQDVDPLWQVIREGGPHHARFTDETYRRYLKRLEQTGRGEHVTDLEAARKRFYY
ncbi:MAG: sulfatase, partial [Deltaproteobacteria bacterium]|nr:sulfatase [Deltaproteobacteria bacterium]